MSVEVVTAFLGLGANLGDRASSLRAALRALHAPPSLEVVRASTFYETAPVGVTGQPDFLNAVAEVRTTLPPAALLARLLGVEQQLGRVRTERWGPRVIDIDILLYGDQALALPGLTVPHPRAAERSFVLQPLAEIAPDARFPDGEAAQKKWQRLSELGNNDDADVV